MNGTLNELEGKYDYQPSYEMDTMVNRVFGDMFGISFAVDLTNGGVKMVRCVWWK